LSGLGRASFDPTECVAENANQNRGRSWLNARRDQKYKREKGATARPKARKVAKPAQAKATKRTVAKAKPKPAPVKKVVRKVKRPIAPVVETVAVEVIEQPVAVTEVEETRKAS
jgi:hypothetical protein